MKKRGVERDICDEVDRESEFYRQNAFHAPHLRSKSLFCPLSEIIDTVENFARTHIFYETGSDCSRKRIGAR